MVVRLCRQLLGKASSLQRLVAQTEVSDDEFEQLKQPGKVPTADPASQHGLA
jgi:hypothetical protein